MRPHDFAAMVGICLIWAVNAVASRYVIAVAGIPPLFLSAARFFLAALVLAPLLRPLPRPLSPVIATALLMGAGHFGLLLCGYGLVDASLAAILLQIGIPMTALFSALILGEAIGVRKLVGIATALCGVVIVLWRPGHMSVGAGAMLIVLAAASLALGSVLLKKTQGMTPLRTQAWTAASSCLPLFLASMAFETDQLSQVGKHAVPFIALLIFSAIIVTVISHTAYYRLLKLYDVSVVSSLTLMFPLMTVCLGIFWLGEATSAGFWFGSALALVGVAILLASRTKVDPALQE
ncbi:DMT family transporter [Rhizobium sp. 2MFCol3.1]|uniref:DMT family transporter n=1 Tax=Rhizobium sp. 2MFCol3.1 TaxID=1246459 RepID=UPI0003610E19|nr:DMT family transporter [Rhizobium sp. 2MFCol3.1]